MVNTGDAFLLQLAQSLWTAWLCFVVFAIVMAVLFLKRSLGVVATLATGTAHEYSFSSLFLWQQGSLF